MSNLSVSRVKQEPVEEEKIDNLEVAVKHVLKKSSVANGMF